jgi:hypothetical protein
MVLLTTGRDSRLDDAACRLDADGLDEPLRSMSRDYNRDWRVNAALSMPKVPNAGERHGDSKLVGGLNNLGVPH